MNKATEDNIDEIVNLIKKAEEFNGHQMSQSIHTELHQIRGTLLRLSDGDVDFYFERTNSNARVGMYKITLKCTGEVEEFVKQHMQ